MSEWLAAKNAADRRSRLAPLTVTHGGCRDDRAGDGTWLDGLAELVAGVQRALRLDELTVERLVVRHRRGALP